MSLQACPRRFTRRLTRITSDSFIRDKVKVTNGVSLVDFSGEFSCSQFANDTEDLVGIVHSCSVERPSEDGAAGVALPGQAYRLLILLGTIVLGAMF